MVFANLEHIERANAWADFSRDFLPMCVPSPRRPLAFGGNFADRRCNLLIEQLSQVYCERLYCDG